MNFKIIIAGLLTVATVGGGLYAYDLKVKSDAERARLESIQKNKSFAEQSCEKATVRLRQKIEKDTPLNYSISEEMDLSYDETGFSEYCRRKVTLGNGGASVDRNITFKVVNDFGSPLVGTLLDEDLLNNGIDLPLDGRFDFIKQSVDIEKLLTEKAKDEENERIMKEDLTEQIVFLLNRSRIVSAGEATYKNLTTDMVASAFSNVLPKGLEYENNVFYSNSGVTIGLFPHPDHDDSFGLNIEKLTNKQCNYLANFKFDILGIRATYANGKPVDSLNAPGLNEEFCSINEESAWIQIISY